VPLRPDAMLWVPEGGDPLPALWKITSTVPCPGIAVCSSQSLCHLPTLKSLSGIEPRKTTVTWLGSVTSQSCGQRSTIRIVESARSPLVAYRATNSSQLTVPVGMKVANACACMKLAVGLATGLPAFASESVGSVPVAPQLTKATARKTAMERGSIGDVLGSRKHRW